MTSLASSDPADKLVIIVAGKVSVEFEHSTIHRNSMVLKDGDYVGDMAILGDEDWANSTCFHFPPTGAAAGALLAAAPLPACELLGYDLGSSGTRVLECSSARERRSCLSLGAKQTAGVCIAEQGRCEGCGLGSSSG